MEVSPWEYNKLMIIENFYKARPPRIYRKTAPTLRADRLGLLVLVSPKSTSTPAKFIKNISHMNNARIAGWHENENVIASHRGDKKRSTCGEHVYHKTTGILTTLTSAHQPKIIVSADTNPMEASPTSTQQLFPTSTSLLADSLAKRFQSLESELALRTPEELSSMMSLELSKKSTPNLCYLKMSKDSFLTTVEELSKPSSPRLQNWGMLSNGKCLTQRISESHRIGKECSLSDILEDSVDDKYFLSEKQKNLIFSRPKNYQCKLATRSGQIIPMDSQMKPMFSQTNRVYDKSGNCPTIPTPGGGSSHPEDFRIRRLTPTECERLMGLPDGWTEGVSDTQKYKLCGNGVVVNVVEEIIKRLL